MSEQENIASEKKGMKTRWVVGIGVLCLFVGIVIGIIIAGSPAEMKDPDPRIVAFNAPIQPTMPAKPEKMVIVNDADKTSGKFPKHFDPIKHNWLEINGNIIVVDKDSKVELDIDETVTGETHERAVTTNGNAVGLGITSSADNITSDFSGASPNLNMNGLNTRGNAGTFTYLSEYSMALTTSNSSFLYVLGGLFIAGGIIVMILLKNIPMGLSFVAAGGALVATGVLITEYPWVILLAFIAIIVVGIVVFFDTRKKGRLFTTVKAIVKGVDESDEESARKVKDKIEMAANGKAIIVKGEVLNAKKANLAGG